MDRENISDAEKAKLWENKYLYLAADFDNFRKNTNKRITNIEKNKHKDLVVQLLEVIDNCERSFRFDEANKPLYDQLLSILTKDGLELITTRIGDTFNDDVMNAVGTTHTSDPSKDNSVSDIIRKGYIYKGEIIRFADVMVYKKG